MGINGLWKLLDPIGRRISIESLEHTTLAIDVSIWLTQFLKAMRDDEGEPVRNAHLLGTLRRCLKLLFTGIRPVFVFDGGVPAAKARLIRQRQLRREQEADEAKALARTILQSRLRQMSTKSVSSPQQSKDEEEEEPETWERADSSSSSEEEEELDVDAEVDIVALASLPASLRKEAVEVAQRKRRVAARTEFMPVAGDMEKYSQAQLSTFLKAAAFHKKIDQAEKRIDKEDGADLSRRIHSDAARRFFLIQEDESPSGSRGGGVKARMERFLANNSEWDGESEKKETPEDAFEESHLNEEKEIERLADMSPAEAAAEGLLDDDEAAAGGFLVDEQPSPRIGDDDEASSKGDDEESLGGGFVVAEEQRPEESPRSAVSEEEEEEEPEWEAAEEEEDSQGEDGKEDVVLELECEDASKLRNEIDMLFDTTKEAPKVRFEEEKKDAQSSSSLGETIAAAMKTAESMTGWAGQAFRRALSETGMSVDGRTRQTAPTLEAEEEEEEFIGGEEEEKEEPLPLEEEEEQEDEEEEEDVAVVENASPSQPVKKEEIAPGRQHDFYSVCPDFDEQLSFALENSEDCDVVGMRKSLDTLSDEKEREATKFILDAVVAKRAASRGIPETCYEVCPDIEDQVEYATEHAEECDVAALRESALSSKDDREREVKNFILKVVEDERMRVAEAARTNRENAARLKRHKRDGDRVTNEMRDEVMELLGILGVPVVEAPMEAEAQCAYLEREGLVEGVVTDDSDAFVFGAKRVYKNIFDDRKFVVAYYSSDARLEHRLESTHDFTTLALLLGGDYCHKVKNVGIVNAMEVLAAFKKSDEERPTETLTRFREWLEGADMKDDDKIDLFARTHKTARVRFELPPGFPSKEAERAYLTPRVHDVEHLRRIVAADTRQSDDIFDVPPPNGASLFRWNVPDTTKLRDWCRETLGWLDSKFDTEVGPVLKKIRERATSGRVTRRIDSYFDSYHSNKRHAVVRSDRLRQVISGSAAVPKKEKKTKRLRKKKKKSAEETEEDGEDVEVAADESVAEAKLPRTPRTTAATAKRKLQEISEEEEEDDDEAIDVDFEDA